MQEARKASFSQRHPFLFGFGLILLAAALFAGVAAYFGLGEGAGNLFATGDALGIVRVEGEIMDAEQVTDWIKELSEDSSVKGVLVRINSPGGAVAPSQEIYMAIGRLADVKPVVCSMGTMAASGGYYAASACDAIYAMPSTLTGSIGVIAQMPDLRALLDKLGVQMNQLTSGKLKAAGSPFSELTPEQRAYLQAMIDDIHRQFVADVAAGRGMDVEYVAGLADGRAMTGSQALDVGLVDELGDMHDAMDQLAAMSGVSGRYRLRDGPGEEDLGLRELLSEVAFDVLGRFTGLNPGQSDPSRMASQLPTLR